MAVQVKLEAVVLLEAVLDLPVVAVDVAAAQIVLEVVAHAHQVVHQLVLVHVTDVMVVQVVAGRVLAHVLRVVVEHVTETVRDHVIIRAQVHV